MYGQSLFFQVGHRYETCLHYLQLMPKGKRDVFSVLFSLHRRGNPNVDNASVGFQFGIVHD